MHNLLRETEMKCTIMNTGMYFHGRSYVSRIFCLRRSHEHKRKCTPKFFYVFMKLALK